ncbi:hypothetical protein [Streptomyces sp. DH24]|uniref:hypothetical protein n=1 Tax=Streptomyces sp. DH24 TaxID=3040123 RepID=UPI0024426C8D|nr:hypothetical protein [Streptomyces sp. DH24]MDG9719785.1 hypothetical protein [Streptomyces sp. DH24]
MPVRDETRAGDERDAFKHWDAFKHCVDADADSCSTRNEALLVEAVNAPERSGRCTLAGGTWCSPYDDTWVDGARGLDIDHLDVRRLSGDRGQGQGRGYPTPVTVHPSRREP